MIHVLPHAGGGAESFIDMLERLPGVAHERFRLSRGRSPVDALTSVPLSVPRLAVRLRHVDLVQTHGDVATAIALPLLRLRPSVMTCQGLHMLRRVTGARRSAFVTALAAAISQCRLVICSSEAERGDLEAIVRAQDRRKLLVIDNGVDVPAPLDETRRRAIRDELGATPETVLGIFVGQLEARKAPVLAARAAIRARETGIPFVLAVAGDGPEADAVRALGGEAVRPLGFRSDVDELLAAADVFVQSSEREGMSFALLEAMAHGLAIVATDGPGNPEALGDAGLLFAAGDESELTAALRRLSIDGDLRATLRERARVRARERFTVERFLAAIEQTYHRALTGPGRDAGAGRA